MGYLVNKIGGVQEQDISIPISPQDILKQDRVAGWAEQSLRWSFETKVGLQDGDNNL